jgi:hypothetical protein
MKYFSKTALILFFLMVVSVCLQGCIHLPSSKPELPSFPLPGQLQVPGIVGKVTAALTHSASHNAIQMAVNWQTTLCILGGLACLAFGGLAIYGGQIVPGVKLVVAGVLLPIFGIWWSYHWLLVVCLILIGAAVYWLLMHWAFLKPAMTKVETWAKTVETRITPVVPTPVVAHSTIVAHS